ncbi:MAG: hypothetical protein H0V49_12295 [Nocardioidaceae bacterium]|nr:hypothetical protein [Nocardioidaceae bacterium]
MTETPEEIPEASEQLDQMQPEDTLLDRGTDDILDEGYSPPERYSAAERFGNTATEQREGETLDQRIAQEEPDVAVDYSDEFLDDGEVGTERAGRLVDPDGGFGQDFDAELIGEDVGIDGAGASAEEAAVHIIEDVDPLLDN